MLAKVAVRRANLIAMAQPVAMIASLLAPRLAPLAVVHRRQDFPRNDPGDISVFLCNILEVNNIKPKRVLKAKNLSTNDMQDAFAIQALFEADAPYMPETVASDTDASGTDHSLIDSQASDASDD